MYRLLFPVFLTLNAVSAAPQDVTENSNVTYVQIQPLVNNDTQADSVIQESKIEKIPLTIPGTAAIESNGVSRQNRTDVITTEIDQSETTTYTPETTRIIPVKRTTTEKITTPTDVATTLLPIKPSFIKPKPKFVSKLSYYNKASSFDVNAAKNLVERVGKRKYKSRCRCEKIWNCPKLQITVPRCPDEYFLCCF
ncbi:uncharacterized protein LOC119832995 [Zerene cesonia]|uniref:uncharacterized protein LOC119832995 n=1 Tax=Zerene cesonia TaxID=33412 RepID=UPI0018E4DF24|nr:uncharacterized protein LOC119832995 [Zerene cesonia]